MTRAEIDDINWMQLNDDQCIAKVDEILTDWPQLPDGLYKAYVPVFSEGDVGYVIFKSTPKMLVVVDTHNAPGWASSQHTKRYCFPHDMCLTRFEALVKAKGQASAKLDKMLREYEEQQEHFRAICLAHIKAKEEHESE